MKRRGFLKALIAAPAIPYVPALAAPIPVTSAIRDVNGLWLFRQSAIYHWDDSLKGYNQWAYERDRHGGITVVMRRHK